MANITEVKGVEVRAPVDGRAVKILTPGALEFVAALQRQFGATRKELLAARRKRQAAFDAGKVPGFLNETKSIRGSEWSVPPPPRDLRDRRVEITGPVDRKMVIN